MAILDIIEAAKFLKMSRRSLETLVRDGKVPGTQLVGKWVFSEQQLVKHVEDAAMDMARQSPHDLTTPTVSKRRRNAIPS